MTEDVEPMVRVDPERTKAFVRGLMPRIGLEAMCIVAGVTAYFITGQVAWLIGGVLLGSLPVVVYVLKFARDNHAGAAMTGQPGARVVRNIVE